MDLRNRLCVRFCCVIYVLKVCPFPEHVLVVDLEEPHCPGADDQVGHVDAHVEEQQPRAAPHTAPFPGNPIGKNFGGKFDSGSIVTPHLYLYGL